MMQPLNFLASLDCDPRKTPAIRRANGIICTIGPVTQSVEALEKLIEAGMNVVRMNFSHGDHKYHAQTIANARQAAKNKGVVLAIALDTKGPEIRTGTMKSGPTTYNAGDKFKVTTDPAEYGNCGPEQLYMDYANITKVIKVGDLCYVDDGLLSLEVNEIGSNFLMVTAKNTATISDKKGVNLPNINVDLPALSDKDKGDLKFGIEQGVDMIFASFIRKVADVQQVRDCLEGKNIKIISKIENEEGVRNFSEVLKACDGIMVARGDLGIEVPPEKVFVCQKMMIAQCALAGKPSICATQMLESMTTNPRPTRAEVSDVANAVMDGADCVMLSGETAKGSYPCEAVTIMAKICKQAQATSRFETWFQAVRSAQPIPLPIEEAVCQSAVNSAAEVAAKAIITLTNSGNTARVVAKYRPSCPILAVVTQDEAVARQLLITRDVIPMMGDVSLAKKDYEGRVRVGLDRLKEMGLCATGDPVVVVHADGCVIGHANMCRVVTA